MFILTLKHNSLSVTLFSSQLPRSINLNTTFIISPRGSCKTTMVLLILFTNYIGKKNKDYLLGFEDVCSSLQVYSMIIV